MSLRQILVLVVTFLFSSSASAAWHVQVQSKDGSWEKMGGSMTHAVATAQAPSFCFLVKGASATSGIRIVDAETGKSEPVSCEKKTIPLNDSNVQKILDAVKQNCDQNFALSSSVNCDCVVQEVKPEITRLHASTGAIPGADSILFDFMQNVSPQCITPEPIYASRYNTCMSVMRSQDSGSASKESFCSCIATSVVEGFQKDRQFNMGVLENYQKAAFKVC